MSPLELASRPATPTSRPRFSHPPVNDRRVIEAYHSPQALAGTRWIQFVKRAKDSTGWLPLRKSGGLSGAVVALIIVCLIYLQAHPGDSRPQLPHATLADNRSVAQLANSTLNTLHPFPVQRLPPLPTSPAYKTQRYLSFLPHSGFHNQRLALENALTLAALLDRTLLLPPVWLGLAIPYISYDKLVKRIQAVDKRGLEHCREWYSNGINRSSLPRECLDYFDFTTLSWDVLIDMPKVLERVQVVDRTDFSNEWLTRAIGIDLSRDVHWLKDSTPYQFRIYGDASDDDELGKFQTRMDVSMLRAPEVHQKRLLAIGSLFGTTRMHLTDPVSADLRSHFRESMAFRQPLLESASDKIKEQMGGEAGYYGIHIRLGDGIFQANAIANAAKVMEELALKKMKLPKESLDRVMDMHRAREAKGNAYGVHPKDDPKFKPRSLYENTVPHPRSSRKNRGKRANSQPQKEGAYNHKPLPPLPVIKSMKDLPFRPGMKCRGKLWKDDTMLPFNAPLFIATDSARPTTDPTLSLFFSTFPCTFILGDFFNSVEELDNLSKLRNTVDLVGLGGFFIPFVDAMVASKGRAVVGTIGSTFSRFAVDVLHQKYHGWPILERG